MNGEPVRLSELEVATGKERLTLETDGLVEVVIGRVITPVNAHHQYILVPPC